MAYPLVHIHNSTRYTVTGKVSYMSMFCADDKYEVFPFDTWTAKSRGVCLLTKITATVHLEDGTEAEARPYQSSGTSYSGFAVVQLSENTFAVSRLVTGTDADVGDISDYAEPTEAQK